MSAILKPIAITLAAIAGAGLLYSAVNKWYLEPRRALVEDIDGANATLARHRDAAQKKAAVSRDLQAIVDRTDGVPLFIEELTAAVLETRTSASGSRGAGSAAPISAELLPETLHASLLARLDRLGTQAKEVAQVGAVCGREFSYGLVQAMHPLSEPELEAALAKLVDAELLHARGLAPDATYTFKHALVQDAAYESLLKSRRRTLHAQAAAALMAQNRPVADEHPELLAHHHELVIRCHSHHRCPVRAVNQMKLLDLVTVLEAHALLTQTQPALVEQGDFGQHSPGSRHTHAARLSRAEAA